MCKNVDANRVKDPKNCKNVDANYKNVDADCKNVDAKYFKYHFNNIVNINYKYILPYSNKNKVINYIYSC